MSEERRQASSEPEITINGQRLDQAQAMAVRVAATNFHSQCSTPNPYDDQLGRGMDKDYAERLTEVLGVMLRRPVP